MLGRRKIKELQRELAYRRRDADLVEELRHELKLAESLIDAFECNRNDWRDLATRLINEHVLCENVDQDIFSDYNYLRYRTKNGGK